MVVNLVTQFTSSESASQTQLLLPHHPPLPVCAPHDLVRAWENIFLVHQPVQNERWKGKKQTFSRPGYLDGLLARRNDDRSRAEPFLDALVQILAAEQALVQDEVGHGPVVVSVREHIQAGVTIVNVDERDCVRGRGVELVFDRLGVPVAVGEDTEDFPALEFDGVVALELVCEGW